MLLTPLQSYFAAYYILDRLLNIPESPYLSTPVEYLSYFEPECEANRIYAAQEYKPTCFSNDPGYWAHWLKALSQILNRKGPADVEQHPDECGVTPEQMLAALVMHLHEYSQYHFVGLTTIMDDINRERTSETRDSRFWIMALECCEKAKQRLADDFAPGRRSL